MDHGGRSAAGGRAFFSSPTRTAPGRPEPGGGGGLRRRRPRPAPTDPSRALWAPPVLVGPIFPRARARHINAHVASQAGSASQAGAAASGGGARARLPSRLAQPAANPHKDQQCPGLGGAAGRQRAHNGGPGQETQADSDAVAVTQTTGKQTPHPSSAPMALALAGEAGH